MSNLAQAGSARARRRALHERLAQMIEEVGDDFALPPPD